MRQKLLGIYRLLLAHYGPQAWWPARGPFEVMVGAILTQSAAWGNVEKAIERLRDGRALSPAALRRTPVSEIAQLVYPSGYYNAKARKLKALATFLGERWDDDLARLFARDVAELRQELLSVHGIGEETADSIILYAAHRPIFVIDAYTRRILSRLGLGASPLHPSSFREGGGRMKGYAAWQRLFMNHLPQKTALFNEYHALLVRHGKETCRRAPRCGGCCLGGRCPYLAR
ncbi:MAG: endonuclease III domain-containing protein [Dehalococcoidia bacterium]